MNENESGLVSDSVLFRQSSRGGESQLQGVNNKPEPEMTPFKNSGADSSPFSLPPQIRPVVKG